MEAVKPSKSGWARVPWILVLVCLVVAAPAARADEEDDAAREMAAARERLLHTARNSVDPSDRAVGDLDTIKADVAAKRALLAATAAPRLAQAEELLGTARSEGLIREAAVLFRWLDAEEAEPGLLVLRDPTGRASPRPWSAENTDEETLAWQLDVRMQADGTVPAKGIAALRNVSPRPHRYALIHAEELRRPHCRRLVDARAVQAGLREKAYRAERPQPGLVTERMVRVKEQRAEAARTEMTQLEEMRDRILDALDGMVSAERYWSMEAGRLAFEIEAVKGREGSGDPKTEAGRALETLELDEIVYDQERRLIYIAVRRAELRRRLYEDAITAIRKEFDAAKAALALFANELNKIRRERQLDRLAYDARGLRKDAEAARARADDPDERDASVWRDYAGLLDDLAKLNAVALEAVQLRRALEARTRGPATAEGVLDESAVQDALANLDGLDGAETADLYAVADDRITDLEAGRRIGQGIAAIDERFLAAKAAAEESIARLTGGASSASWRYRLSRQSANRDHTIAAYQETARRGIEPERARIERELSAVRDLRSRLARRGAKSFQIRVERALEGERLEEAYDDAESSARGVWRWLTLQGEPHIGTFLAGNWSVLLACLAVLVVSILAVRWSRRRLDGVLNRLAARVPHLRTEPITVQAEEAEAREQKEQEEAAVKAAEAAALLEVSKQQVEAVRSPGEGGAEDEAGEAEGDQ